MYILTPSNLSSCVNNFVAFVESLLFSLNPILSLFPCYKKKRIPKLNWGFSFQICSKNAAATVHLEELVSSHQPIDMKSSFFDMLYVFLLRKHRYICTYIISTNRYKVVFGTFFNRLCVFLLTKHSPRQSESCSDLAKNQHKFEVHNNLFRAQMMG